MSASPSEIVGPAPCSSDQECGFAQVTLRLSPTDAAVVLKAAAVRCQTVTQFTLQAVLAEAQRVTTDNHALATATTDRLTLIDEVFDRLAGALGESEKTLHTLGDLIERTNHRT
jgi:uncharacterized protein (DUF1778 family)